MRGLFPDYENWPAAVRAELEPRVRELVDRYGEDIPRDARRALFILAPPAVKEWLTDQAMRSLIIQVELRRSRDDEV
jgi:hypothetical protein